MKKVLIFARMGCKIVAVVQTLPKEGEDFTPESTDFESAGSAFQAYEMFEVQILVEWCRVSDKSGAEVLE